MPDEICNGQQPLIKALYSPLCVHVVFILSQGKCSGWLQYMYKTFFVVICKILLPTVTNQIYIILSTGSKNSTEQNRTSSLREKYRIKKMEGDYSSWNLIKMC